MRNLPGLYVEPTSPVLAAVAVQLLSRVQLFVTLWTVAHQALCPRDSSGKNTGVGCHSLLQGIFPTPGIEPGSPILHWQADSYPLYHQGSPEMIIMFSLHLYLASPCETCSQLDGDYSIYQVPGLTQAIFRVQ